MNDVMGERGLGFEYHVYDEDMDVDIHSALDFFKGNDISDLKRLCVAILKHGGDVVREHAWAIVIEGEDEDENMRPIYDVPCEHLQMATTALEVTSWSRDDLESLAD